MEPSRTANPTRTERASAALRRVLDIAARVLRGLTLLAFAAAAATGAAWLAWLADAPPPDPQEWIVRLVALGMLLAPPAILLLFVAGLRDLGRLPERARGLPEDVRNRARDLDERARPTPKRRGVIGILVALVRLARVVLGSREVLSPYAAVTIALRPAILVAALFATLVAVLEIPAGIVALALLLLT
jgi:hypothetical protein